MLMIKLNTVSMRKWLFFILGVLIVQSSFSQGNIIWPASDEELITNILKSNGYYFADVNTKYKENSNNTIDLIFNINLGDKAFIKKIKFIGDKRFKDRKLRSVIISEESKFWKFISSRKYLDIKTFIKFNCSLAV